jgi:hypothetical protein
MLLALTFVALVGLDATDGPSLPVVPDRESSAFLGSCQRENGSYLPLNKMLVLEADELTLDEPLPNTRLAVRRENVHVTRNGATTTYNVPTALAGDDSIDLTLRLVTLEGDLLIYWRETFLHQRFRQGLMRLTTLGLQQVCQGMGGFDVAH